MDFLHYIEHTDETLADESGSENIRKIHECVKRLKASEEIGVKYMQTWEERILDRERGKAEGKVEGKAESIISFLKDLGEPSKELKQMIFAQKDLKVLDQWLKLAARAGDMETFVKQIQESRSL